MKKPYYNLHQRLMIRLDTFTGAFMRLNIVHLKLCREIVRRSKRSKFLLFIFSVVGSYSEKRIDNAYDKGFKDAMVKYRKD